MQFKDYYKIMGLSRGASQEEIKRAYRKLARKYHPDVSKEANAEERFKEIGEAYEVLKDPEKRAAYDQLGTRWKPGEEFRPPPDWDFGFEVGGFGREGFRREGFGREGFRRSQFSDFFESLFGEAAPFGGRHPRQEAREFRARGQDQHAKIQVSLEEAFHGVTRMLQLQSPEPDAVGRVALATKTLNVKIPAGVTHGQQIRLQGQGSQGRGGGAAGDLYLEVELLPHRLFQVEGRDVHLSLPIAPWEAALGATVAVPTLGGTVDMRIPAGSQSGRRLRLRARGLPGKPPGDQYVTLQIVTPPATDESLREIYRRMARESGFDPRSELKGVR
jgi:curved DNA-binding protein